MSDDIARLEARITELEAQHTTLKEQLDQARMDQWEGRIDDLEVQAKLGSMEVADKLDPLLAKLRDSWLDAKEQATKGTDTAGDVFDTLRTGLRSAVDDIRTAVVDARKTAASS